MIDSRNEWDPLEEIIVGEASMANWPTTDPVFAHEMANSSWKDTPPPTGPISAPPASAKVSSEPL